MPTRMDVASGCTFHVYGSERSKFSDLLITASDLAYATTTTTESNYVPERVRTSDACYEITRVGC
jgi:hypothetical protein